MIDAVPSRGRELSRDITSALSPSASAIHSARPSRP
jgi:hypothetical protein